MTKIFIASDHGGYQLKEKLKFFVRESGYLIEDLGTDSEDSVDYPDFAYQLCQRVEEQKAQGILICGTGIGMSIVANRHLHIRAALCYDIYSAQKSREHNDANVLCLGGRVIGEELAKEIVHVWLNTKFTRDERHVRRVKKINLLCKIES